MNLAAGTLDRRIRIEAATGSQDAAGDEVQAWNPPAGWPNRGARWARLVTTRGAAGDMLLRADENAAPEGVFRQADTIVTLRYDTKSRQIAPESHRVIYQERIYEIVGIGEAVGRQDGMVLLCSSRPDKRGARGPEALSGET